jgi:hypothetical protein
VEQRARKKVLGTTRAFFVASRVVIVCRFGRMATAAQRLQIPAFIWPSVAPSQDMVQVVTRWQYLFANIATIVLPASDHFACGEGKTPSRLFFHAFRDTIGVAGFARSLVLRTRVTDSVRLRLKHESRRTKWCAIQGHPNRPY